jgi:DNA-binding transcriptional ArsR family regulator
MEASAAASKVAAPRAAAPRAAALTKTFDVIADPTRRRILDLLRVRPRPVNELVGLLGLSQPGVSKHLKVLRDAHLVRVRREAQRRWYEVDPVPLGEVAAWLEPYRAGWADRLDKLEEHLDRTALERTALDRTALDRKDQA